MEATTEETVVERTPAQQKAHQLDDIRVKARNALSCSEAAVAILSQYPNLIKSLQEFTAKIEEMNEILGERYNFHW